MISIVQQIKNNLVIILQGLIVNSKTVKIFMNDPLTLEESELPAITIQTTNIPVESTTLGYPREQQRQLNIDISCLYQSTKNLDTIVEEFATLIQEKLSETEEIVGLNGVNGIIISNELQGIEYRDFDEIATTTAGATISYVVTYYCAENNLRAVI